MQREFNVYRPIQIARFVKTLFKGQFVVKGVGSFDFDQGKVQLPNIKDPHCLNVYREVNQAISQLNS